MKEIATAIHIPHAPSVEMLDLYHANLVVGQNVLFPVHVTSQGRIAKCDAPQVSKVKSTMREDSGKRKTTIATVLSQR